MYIESYKDLTVWKKSIDLVMEIYKITEDYPKSEIYSLVSQMRRSSISIPSNIAEGYRRKNLKEYLHFLSISNGSAAELETQIIISKRIYNNQNFSKVEAILEEVQKMLYVMIRNLRQKETER